jgi:magnesium transporter
MQFKKKKNLYIGNPPGTLKDTQSSFSCLLVSYDESNLTEVSINKLAEFKKVPSQVNWVDISGSPGKEDLIVLNESYDVPMLILEKIQQNSSLPMIEDHGSYLFICFRAFSEALEGSEMVSMLLFDDMVWTFSESKTPLFQQVLNRIRNGMGRIRRKGCDYLAFALLDASLETFYPFLEGAEKKLEEVEMAILKDATAPGKILQMRRQYWTLRSELRPLIEVSRVLKTTESDLLSDELQMYYSDFAQQSLELLANIESLREQTGSLLELISSRQNTHMNRIMKTLTIVAAIFLPLSFIAGVYGMNFQYMPELNAPLGYPIVLSVMFLLALGMVLYFNLKNWWK